MAIRHLQCFGVTDIDLFLARSPFALGVLDRNAGVLQAVADGPHDRLYLGGLEDMVVLDIAAGRFGPR